MCPNEGKRQDEEEESGSASLTKGGEWPGEASAEPSVLKLSCLGSGGRCRLALTLPWLPISLCERLYASKAVRESVAKLTSCLPRSGFIYSSHLPLETFLAMRISCSS